MASISRRKIIKDSLSLATFSALSPYIKDITQRKNPWRVALVGTGWYGKSDLMRLSQIAKIRIVGLCDVDTLQLASAVKLVQQRLKSHPTIPTYSDYRMMLQKEQPEIVLIGSPDHWHALQAIDAMKAGAHVYLQKPISVDVLEGEAITEAARIYKKVVQIGTQRRSTHHLIDAKRTVIESGLLGKISHVDMCCYYHMRSLNNPTVMPIPKHLDYDMYVGPAPYRPYDGLPHRGWWRAQMEYSNGIMGDMCVHMYDTVRWLLNLGHPEQVYSSGGIYVQKDSKANTPDTQSAIFTHKDLNCNWQHRSWGSAPDPDYPWGFFIYGEKGTLKGSVYKYEFFPIDNATPIRQDVVLQRDQFPEDLNEQDIELHTAPATRNHLIDFLYAIENRTTPIADVSEGHISTASCIIANISMSLGRPLQYDWVNKIVIDDEEATQLLKRKYRQPWIHPYPA